MVEGNKNKGQKLFLRLLLGVAAATALVGAALLYHYVFAEEGAEDGEDGGAGGDTMAELEAAKLNEVRKHPNGNMLAPDYMVKLLNFVTQTARKRRAGEKATAMTQRREAYKSENWAEYREIVREQFMKEDQMCQLIMKEVLDCLPETNEMEFNQTMAQMAQNPQYAQMIMAAQQGKLPSDDQLQQAKATPKLEKSKTLTAFEESKKLTMEAMKKQAGAQRQQTMPGGGMDEMEMMIDMFVDQAKIEDALFIKCGVQNEELEEAIMYFIGKDDPDVKKAMGAYMMEMQQEMQKMGGGPGGMGGMGGM